MAEVFKNLDWSVLTDILLAIIPALICITIHELSHGLAAYLMGDTMAKDEGRLSLNPLRHIDVMGLVMLVVFKIGWAKPVPINMDRFKNPKAGMAISALAGPGSNFILACAALFLYGFLYPFWHASAVGGTVLETIYVTAYLSIGLGVFNLLPVPPLDGSKVLFAVLPDTGYRRLMYYERYGMLLLFALAFFGVLSGPLQVVIGFIMEHLFGVAQFAFELGKHFI